MDENRSKQGPRTAYFWFAAMAVVCCAADLATKHYVINLVRQSPGEPMEKRIVLWPGRFELLDRLNDAGLWSIGHGDPRSNMILAAAGFGIVAMIVAIGLRSLQPQDRFFALVLGAILGGAAGNLHDRIRFNGVRDFIQVYLWNGYAYPTFNVADSCLVCAALVWIGSWIFLPSETAPKTQPAVADA